MISPHAGLLIGRARTGMNLVSALPGIYKADLGWYAYDLVRSPPKCAARGGREHSGQAATLDFAEVRNGKLQFQRGWSAAPRLGSYGRQRFNSKPISLQM